VEAGFGEEGEGCEGFGAWGEEVGVGVAEIPGSAGFWVVYEGLEGWAGEFLEEDDVDGWGEGEGVREEGGETLFWERRG
jgi:hypothetical protein